MMNVTVETWNLLHPSLCDIVISQCMAAKAIHQSIKT